MLIHSGATTGRGSKRRRQPRGQLSCPGCGEPVTLAKGRIRRPYFGHRPGAVCSYAALETCAGASAGQGATLPPLIARGSLSCDVEVEVLSVDGDPARRRVLLHAPGEAYRVALEVQHSTLDYATLERHTGAWLGRRCCG